MPTEFLVSARRDDASMRVERPPARRKVLLAEADGAVAEAFRQGLEAAGFEVIGPASTLTEALALASTSESLHAAVLGARLGEESTDPVADILRGRSAPFAFTIADESSDLPPAHRLAPRWAKPLDGATLAARTRALIRG